MAALLDVNVLVALAWPSHAQHRAARRWFTQKRPNGWATCTLTQAGFVRVSAQLPGSEGAVPVGDGLRSLQLAIGDPFHQFWTLDTPITELHPEIRDQLRGPRQLTDALLLDLAIRRGGTLATFDQKIRALLPADSPLQATIQVIGGNAGSSSMVKHSQGGDE